METEELLRTFIIEEEKELNRELVHFSGEQGHNFRSENYSALVKAFPKAVKLLQPQELESFYFHYMRMGVLPLKGIEKTYALWEAAYRKQSIFIDKKKYDTFFTYWQSLKGLFVFGYDYRLEPDQNNGYDDYVRYRAVFEKINSYTSLPGMLAKPHLFSEFGADQDVVNRISKAVLALEFIHDHYWNGTPDGHYNYTNLVFWGLMFVLVSSDSEVAKDTISQFKKADSLPKFDDQMEILTRFETAVRTFKNKK